jgi:uncharacterized membrane protein
MMSGGSWGSGAGGWPWFVLLTFVVLAIGLLVLASLRGRAASERRPSSPEEVLRDRYARGELTRRAYREALVDVLKDRYVRGELDLEEYETRLGRLFGDERPLVTSEQAPGQSGETRHSGLIAGAGGRR